MKINWADKREGKYTSKLSVIDTPYLLAHWENVERDWESGINRMQRAEHGCSASFSLGLRFNFKQVRLNELGASRAAAIGAPILEKAEKVCYTSRWKRVTKALAFRF